MLLTVTMKWNDCKKGICQERSCKNFKNKFTELLLRDAETRTARECFFPGFRSVPNGEPNALYAGFREVREQNELQKDLMC